MTKTRLVALAIALLPLTLPSPAGAVNSCNSLFTFDYVTGSNYSVVGDVLRARLTFGAGSVSGGTTLTLHRVRFDLDCDSNFPIAPNCTDDGAFMEYEGDPNITTNCGVTWSTGHGVSTLPNEIVFTPSSPINIPANTPVSPGFCYIEFDVKLLAAPDVDATPAQIEEISYFSISNNDATCDNSPSPLSTNGSQPGAILLCPVCNDSNECTTDTCNQDIGQCVFTNKPDSTPCTDNDSNACTFAGCEVNPSSPTGAFVCGQTHLTTVCTPDTNACTDDPACNPLTGLCTHPNKPASTPCPDTDANLCTFAGCETDPGSPAGAFICSQTHVTTICPPDVNPCTQDPACNTGTGLCTHPDEPNSTPCPDTDADACTTAGCEGGACVQSHISCITTPLHHYQCYEVRKQAFTTVQNVSLVDEFGSALVPISRPDRLCAPADKLDEDPPAPADPIHLMSYKVRAPFTRRDNQRVVNQFGTIFVDVTKRDRLFVPAHKSLSPPPPAPPVPPTIDHFQCYKVKLTAGTPRFAHILVAKVDDQFGTHSIELTRPHRLCAPVNKNNESPGAEAHVDHLFCYKTKAPKTDFTVYIGDQFGQRPAEIIHRRELCVPSLLNP